MHAKSLQSCPTLCDPMDCSPPGSSVHGILQARIAEWVAISFPEKLPNPGIEPGSPALQADSLPAELPGKPSLHGSKTLICFYIYLEVFQLLQDLQECLHLRGSQF